MDPICVAGCAAPLPVVSFDNCTPEVNLSEIEYLLVANSDAEAFTDITDPVEWTARLSNTSTDANAIRQFRVTGDMPAATDQEVTISGNRKVVIDRTNTVNADIDESNDINHEAFRLMQCGGQFKYWFVTRSGHVFGGNAGISGSLKVGLVLARGESAFHTYPLVGTWQNKFMPERALWPIAGATVSTPTFALKYGNKATGTILEADVLAATSGIAPVGGDITVPNGGFGNVVDRFCFVWEPTTETPKNAWYNSVLNQGPIGAGETFLAPTALTVGGIAGRVYVTGFATQFTGSVILSN